MDVVFNVIAATMKNKLDHYIVVIPVYERIITKGILRYATRKIKRISQIQLAKMTVIPI
jgi:hypothetical protein